MSKNIYFLIETKTLPLFWSIMTIPASISKVIFFMWLQHLILLLSAWSLTNKQWTVWNPSEDAADHCSALQFNYSFNPSQLAT